MPYPNLKLLLDGKWTDGTAGRSEPVFCPADGTILGEVPHASRTDLDRALDSSLKGFAIWRNMTAVARQEIMELAARNLEDSFTVISTNLTKEMGKPIAEARRELRTAIDLLRWYAEEGKRVYGRIIPSRVEGLRQEVNKMPVGPSVGLVAWNFPANNVMRKVAGALAAGCSLILKPSEETPATAMAIGQALMDAGLPAGVLNIVFGEPADVSAHLLSSPIPRQLSFTGSVPVGIQLQQLAAQRMIRCTMELGGHAPVIVCDDADIERAAEMCVAGKFRNAGQVCVSPTRFFVHKSIYKKFIDAFVSGVEAIKVGNGLDDGVTMGPLVAQRRIEVMDTFIANALAMGAKTVAGGHRRQSPGFFFSPTVLCDVPDGASIMTEEPFGPIAPISPFDTLQEVITRANSLPFGLAGYAFTNDPKVAGTLKAELEVGMLAINSMHIQSVETPHGGMKMSGYGSEGGIEGMDAYLVTKYTSETYQ